MPLHRLFPSRYRASLAMLLVLALVFAQWQGLAHRIAHAQWHSAHSVQAGGTNSEKDSGASHSCEAFDAATVGDSIHLAPFVAPLLVSTHVLALWLAFISWKAPCTPGFSSRAPPQA